jgi:hypothetical protein
VYSFEALPDPEKMYVVPPAARSELQVSLALGLCWSADLSREFLPFISATDASSSFGFGVCVANASMDKIREVAACAEKRGDYVVLADSVSKQSATQPKSRLGTPHNLDLKQSDFKTILSIPALRKAHNNLLEADAYLMWLRWLLRSTRNHNSRAICLVDSKVVLGGVTKGRSSSRPLLRILRRIAALQLGGNVLVRLVYIPTSFNPSDLASRGVRPRPMCRSGRRGHQEAKHTDKKKRFHNRLKHEVARSAYAAELTELVNDDPFFWKFQKLQVLKKRPK